MNMKTVYIILHGGREVSEALAITISQVMLHGKCYTVSVTWSVLHGQYYMVSVT